MLLEKGKFVSCGGISTAVLGGTASNKDIDR